MTPSMAPAVSAAPTSAGVASGLACKNSAAAPATCGLAIDVPARTAVAVSLAFDADRMSSPGANTSTQVPKLEKKERSSVSGPLAATVIASAVRPGEPKHASVLSLPAASAKVTPAAIALRTA